MKQPRSFYRYDNKDEDNFLSNDLNANLFEKWQAV